MTGIRAIAVVLGLFALCLGLPVALYVFLTADRPRTIAAIRRAATQHGWKFRIRRLFGDPTALRIDGSTSAALPWVLTTRGASQASSAWSSELHIRIPGLAGVKDFEVSPRNHAGRSAAALNSPLPAGLENRVAKFSGTLADALEFSSIAREMPTGVEAFDSAYQVLALPQRFHRSPVDAELARHFLACPEDAVRPVALLAWRDSCGLYLEARLPATPNWSAISWLLQLAESFSIDLPAPETPSAPTGLVDRILDKSL